MSVYINNAVLEVTPAGTVAKGRVYNHANTPDGRKFRTKPLAELNGRIATSKGGNEYRLIGALPVVPLV
jgi:hypothetical protein